MKKAGLISSALFLGALFCLTGPVAPGHAQEGKATVIAKPVRDWQEPPIQDLTGQGGKVVRKICAIESRFDNEVLMAVLRNRENEFALRMFFPTMMFAPGVTYPITLTSADASGSFDAVPVYPGTILVELGGDDALLTSWRDTGSLKAKLSKSSFDFQSGNIDEGLDMLSACADTLNSAVNSAGVAGPLPTGTATTPGMAMPPSTPSVAEIDTPSRVTVADLGGAAEETVEAQSHVQEQMVLKPLKAAAEDESAEFAIERAAPETAEQDKEDGKSGSSMFSIFGDVDESELEEGKITAKKHYVPNQDADVAAVAEDAVTETETVETAETVETVAEVSEVADEPVIASADAAEDMAAPAKPEPAQQMAETTDEPADAPDDDRMIVFAEDKPVSQPVAMPSAPAKKPQSAPKQIESVLAEAQDMEKTSDAPVIADKGDEIESRLEQLEKRLSAEVERNRQLEMQLREMNAKPVTGSASIDLENPDQPAAVAMPEETTTQDRVEAARQEREQIKHEKLEQRMESLTNLLQMAGVRTVANPAPEGSLDAENNAFTWHTGQFYGGAEFGSKPRDVEFSSLVSAYLNATGQRCEGDFASHVERLETRDTGSIATAELVCVGQGADSAAAVVFYEDSQTFGVISHEGSSEELSRAILIRDNIAHALGSKI